MKTLLKESDKEKVGVYVVYNVKTDQIYVGSGKLGECEYRHRYGYENKNHRNKNVQKAFNNTPEGWTFMPIPIEGPGLTLKENRDIAFDLEQNFIDSFHNKTPLFLNISENSRAGGYERTLEIKQKISEANSKRVWNEESKEKLRNIHLGKKHSEETKNKISLGGIGRVFSEETKQKLSETKMGWKPPLNVLTNLNNANKEKSISVIIDNIKYDSVNQAAKIFNVDNRTVDARCKSITGRFDNWEYAKDTLT